VLAAVIGMVVVGWYPLGGQISDEDMEDEVRERIAAKRSRGRFFGLVGKKS
jgi:iron transport multicopper oxidase